MKKTAWEEESASRIASDSLNLPIVASTGKIGLFKPEYCKPRQFVLDGAGKRRAKDLEIPDGASFLGSLRKAGAEFDGNVSGYLESNELAHRLFNAAGVIGEAALESGAAFAGQPDRIDAITNGERAVIPDKWE